MLELDKGPSRNIILDWGCPTSRIAALYSDMEFCVYFCCTRTYPDHGWPCGVLGTFYGSRALLLFSVVLRVNYKYLRDDDLL